VSRVTALPPPDAVAGEVLASPATPASKGEQTRQLVVETALRLFRERGYEATTMRAIAAEAGISVGNAYYYFPSKQHLVQAYYDQSQTLHIEASRAGLDRETTFEGRLRAVLGARVDTMQSEKSFAVGLFRFAADPQSPLSPFSDESAPAREASIGLYAEVVAGAKDVKLSAELREMLPELLWLYQMGVVLFWVHDSSPGAGKTYVLVQRTIPLVVRLVGLARYRLLRGLVDDVLSLVRDLRS